ncbi:hypothetical protein B0H11DRAFT_2268883 [Mycena galericulata]|nr:hypothetical protein B0H11DRAFT_2268883 [Mycena galericulata]
MPKGGYRQRSTVKSTKAQKELQPCSFCGGSVANLQHARVCNEYRKARKDVYQHVMERKRARDSARNHRENRSVAAEHFDPQPMDIVDEEMYPDDDAIAQLPNSQLFARMDVDSANAPVNTIPTVELPPRFIFVKHHPHANRPNEIIPLDTSPSAPNDAGPALSPVVTPAPTDRPWAPFRTYADFKFTSRRIKRRSPNVEINEDLLDLRDGSLTRDSLVTFRNHRDMEKVLAAARVSNVAFECETLNIEFEGTSLAGTYNVDVEFRDPWSIMEQWICDPTLAPVSTWFSQEKYLCLNGTIDFANPLYDEPYTGETWRSVDDDLPGDSHFPSCFLGLHVWLDKGLVSTKVKMHPILLRGCWINSATRNGSGNGGSALHLSSPTTIDYSDGQTFLDILKCALPCLVQILPPNSSLIKLVRAMQKVRTMLGLWVTTGSRNEYTDKLIIAYGKICEDVSEQHDKSLNFLKQHFLSHAVKNFQRKGTSRNMNTRVGEGFQQEVAAQYKKTNGKNAEHQISVMDENEEAMARIQMAVDDWHKNQEQDEQDPILGSSNANASVHWQLGSADPRVTTVRMEAAEQRNPLFRDFNLKLREYLAHHHPSHFVRPDQDIQIEPCKVLYVNYQSKVDWKLARDILRCNSCFHTRPRYDSVIYEAQDDDLVMGQLQLVFRCHLPQKVTLDLAMIRPYRKSSWAARTRTDCPIREWSPGGVIFVALEHVTRGALLCPIFGAPRQVFYVVDCIDEDMFLRVNNID